MELRRPILELVEKNDGKWTWYQLDRGLTAIGWGGRDEFMGTVADLINKGLLVEQHDARYPHPLYRITEAGKAYLRKSD